jgi:diguanylate cyclase (GGDEF)-like protein
MIGTDDETDPPWAHLSVLFGTTPHLLAAAAITTAAIPPYLSGETAKVSLVLAILFVQVAMRACGDYLFRRRSPSDPLQIWLGRFTVISLLSGVAWGAALAILYAESTADTQVAVLAIACGIVQSSAARAYLAPRSTLLVILIVTAFVNLAAIREGNWIMVPICIAYVGFLASYMVRLIAMDEKRVAAERRTRVLVDALADSNEKLTFANEQLRRHARTDALTGLDNRRGFDEQLSRRLLLMHETGQPLALLLMDVDHFKRFNDTYGHQAGDRGLQVVAELLLGSIKGLDAVAARYGGEEFAVLLQGAPARQPAVFAETLRKRVSELSLPTEDGRAAQLTVSIGVAIASPHETETSLIANADRRLYQAKADGRDTVCDDDRAERLLGSA